MLFSDLDECALKDMIGTLIVGDDVLIPTNPGRPSDNQYKKATVVAKGKTTNLIAVVNTGQLLDYDSGDVLIPMHTRTRRTVLNHNAEVSYWETIKEASWTPQPNRRYVLMTTRKLAGKGVKLISEKLCPETPAPADLPEGTILEFIQTEGAVNGSPVKMDLYHYFRVINGDWMGALLMLKAGCEFDRDLFIL